MTRLERCNITEKAERKARIAHRQARARLWSAGGHTYQNQTKYDLAMVAHEEAKAVYKQALSELVNNF